LPDFKFAELAVLGRFLDPELPRERNVGYGVPKWVFGRSIRHLRFQLLHIDPQFGEDSGSRWERQSTPLKKR
jgi:hypothetical protein